MDRSQLAGEVVTFKTKGCGDVAVDTLRGLFVNEGFSSQVVPDLAPKVIAKRALRSVESDKEQIVKPIASDRTTGEPRFQVTRETEDSDGELDYDKESVYSFDVAAKAIKNANNPDRAKEVTKKYVHAEATRTRGDVRTIIKKLFESEAGLFVINEENGGAYFVPSEHFGFTDRVERVMTTLGGEIRRFPVPKSSKDGKKSIQAAMTDWFERLIEELNDAAQAMTDDTRTSTLQNHVKRYNQAKLKLEAAKQYLGESTSGLEEKISDAEQEMKKRIEERLDS